MNVFKKVRIKEKHIKRGPYMKKNYVLFLKAFQFLAPLSICYIKARKTLKLVKMELNYRLLIYFDKKDILSSMKETCSHFIENLNEKVMLKFPPLRFIWALDFMDLLEQYPDLGDVLQKEPLKFQRYCDEILFACLHSVDEFNNLTVLPKQVSVVLRLKSVSRLLFQPYSRRYKGLALYTGILADVSKPTSYVVHSVWCCPEDCEASEVIVQFIPKFRPKCYMCKSVLFENSGLRRCGERVEATFIMRDNLLPRTFIIVDDLILKLKLGCKYDLHAVLLKKTITVWSVEQVTYLRPPITCTIPSDINELFQVCEGIPWKFIYCLASSIGVSVCPLNCFMHLKMSLLLSAMSVKANIATGSNIVHVLAAGYDTSYVGKMMTEATKLAERSVILGTSNTVVSTALIASSGGVCLMPLPIQAYAQKQVASIVSAVESGEVLIDNTRVQLQSAVWAHGMDYKKITLYNIASVFGNVIRGDYGDYNDQLAEFVLQNSVDPVESSEEEIRALQEVKLYLDLVAGIEVTLDKASEILLRNYFLSARRERDRVVSLGSMKTLAAMCLNSARLCRRKTTNIEDAILAIWLHVSGSPEPRFAPDEYLQTPADVRILQTVIGNFKDWLERFTDSFFTQ